MDTKSWSKDVGMMIGIGAAIANAVEKVPEVDKALDESREILRAQRERLNAREGYLNSEGGTVHTFKAKLGVNVQYPRVEFEARGELVQMRKFDTRGQVRGSTIVTLERGRELWKVLQKSYTPSKTTQQAS
jgi:hypothetical protein